MTGRPEGPFRGSNAESEDSRQARSWGKYAGLGVQFAVSIIVFLYVGQWVDRRFGSAPWGIIIGVFTGAGAAFYSMYRRLMADLEQAEKRRGGGGEKP